jgi:hypothetical protein
MTEMAMSKPHATPEPWWRFGLVWMVWAGPALVVLASFASLALALRTPDPVVAQEAEKPNQTAATLARNHAATGVKIKPALPPQAPGQRP